MLGRKNSTSPKLAIKVNYVGEFMNAEKNQLKTNTSHVYNWKNLSARVENTYYGD